MTKIAAVPERITPAITAASSIGSTSHPIARDHIAACVVHSIASNSAMCERKR